MNNTITTSERELYLTLLQLAETHPKANEWLTLLPQWLAAIKNKNNYAHAPAYQSAVDRLPDVLAEHKCTVDLDSDAVSIDIDWSESEYRQTLALLKNLMPWRKGPFKIGSSEREISIDTEWHSDWKWQRVVPHLSPLKGRRILDVGGGSGYHGWRMTGNSQENGAETVIIIDPSCLFYHQFMAIRHFVGTASINAEDPSNQSEHSQTQRGGTHYIPVPLEVLPQHSQMFDTVFSMGVLYHRASPFEHLNLLKGQLEKGGELVLETLVVEGDKDTVLVPQDRYAKMNNVYFLPSVVALTLWLEKAGFTDVRCVDLDITSTEEQRATEWMTYQSLADFLDDKDPSKTVEGHPAPMRAVLIAKRA